MNGRRSADELERRIRSHLLPHFGGRRLATIQTTDINTFVLKRTADVIVFGASEQRQERKVSNGEINRELTTLKRIFNLTRQNGKLTHVPHIPKYQRSRRGSPPLTSFSVRIVLKKHEETTPAPEANQTTWPKRKHA